MLQVRENEISLRTLREHWCSGPSKTHLLWYWLWFYDCLRSSTQIKDFPTLHSSQEQMAMRSFIGNCSSFV